MKQLKVVGMWVVLGLLLLGATCARAGDFTVVPGKSVGRIRLGATRAALIKMLGRPGQSALSAGFRQDLWSSAAPASVIGGRYFTRISYRGDEAIQVEIDSPRYATSGGVSTRTSLTQLLKVYPDLRATHQFHPGRAYSTLLYDDMQKGIAFGRSGDDLQWTTYATPQVSAQSLFVHLRGVSVASPGGISMRDEFAAPRAKDVDYRSYGSYFESNASGLKGDASYLVLPSQQRFDRIFGAAAVMGQNRFLPKNVFNSKVVIAVIKRGNALWKYSVQSVESGNGILSIRYKAVASGAGGASFSSPLILTVKKANYGSVVFVENGRRVATIQAPRISYFSPVQTRVTKASGLTCRVETASPGS